MTRTLIAVAVAAAVIAPAAANAGSQRHHKHQHLSYHHQAYRHQAYHGGAMWRAPVSMQRRVGPPWAGPAECYEDLGYGRYESCDTSN
ncbi:MAG: hypothetical protein V7604_1812 [Hyphomicrobiales bacterium]|jgi:hypothetical protein